LCPGTSSWTTVAGRWTNAVTNIASAASAAVANGGEGVMVTDWGDMGHVQHLVVSEPQFAWAAGCAWNPSACDPADLPGVADAWVFRDTAGQLGDAMRSLGDLHTLVAPQLFNMSILTLPMYRPWTRFGHGPATQGITTAALDHCSAVIERALMQIGTATLDRDDAELVMAEARATATLMALLVDDGRQRVALDGRLDAADAEVLAGFARRLEGIAAEHRRLWSLRNRPGGLDESLANFARLRSIYVPEHHDSAGA
jgi:hypothetical protein